MKYLFGIITLSLLSVIGYSQSIGGRDTTVIRTSTVAGLSGFLQDPVAKVTVTAETFLDGRQGVEFTFTTHKRKTPPVIRLDSILLYSVSLKTLTLHKPYRHSVTSRRGVLVYSAIHYLENADWEFIRKEEVADIGLIIDGKPIMLPLDKKSQRKVNALAGTR